MTENQATPQVEFEAAAKMAFKKIVQFNGRSRRSEYWWGMLAIMLASMVAGFIPIIGILALIPIGLAQCSLTFRRLHDTGRSGWWIGAQGIIAITIITMLFTLIDWSAFLSATAADNEAAASHALLDSFSNGSATLIIVAILYLAHIVLSITIFIFTLLDSQPEDNKYGESTKYIPHPNPGRSFME